MTYEYLIGMKKFFNSIGIEYEICGENYLIPENIDCIVTLTPTKKPIFN